MDKEDFNDDFLFHSNKEKTVDAISEHLFKRIEIEREKIRSKG